MKRLGAVLMAGGAVVWIVGVVAWTSGVWVTLPPETVRALVLSLSAVTGGSLVAAGALISRGRRAHAGAPPPTVQDLSKSAPRLIDGGASISYRPATAARVDDRVT
jgi:hypothetical protein